MTKEEIKTLSIGSKIQLANGIIATVQAIPSQADEMLRFQYDEPIVAALSEDTPAEPGSYANIAAWRMQTNASSEDALEPPPVIPSGTSQQTPVTTTVICRWIELVNTVRLT